MFETPLFTDNFCFCEGRGHLLSHRCLTYPDHLRSYVTFSDSWVEWGKYKLRCTGIERRASGFGRQCPTQGMVTTLVDPRRTSSSNSEAVLVRSYNPARPIKNVFESTLEGKRVSDTQVDRARIGRFMQDLHTTTKDSCKRGILCATALIQPFAPRQPLPADQHNSWFTDTSE